MKTERQEKFEKFLHRTAWYLSMPIALFAVILLIDGWLSSIESRENIISTYQEKIPIDRKHTATQHTVIETDHHKIPITDSTSVRLLVPGGKTTIVTLFVTRIFKVPVEFAFDDNSTRSEVPRTIHTVAFPLKWILLISSLYVLIQKDFSKRSYAVCFLPVVLLVIVLLIML